MLPPVSVNPSSATDARSGALSGVGDQSFYFGPNPNLAMLGGKVLSAPVLIGLALVGAVLLFALRRRR